MNTFGGVRLELHVHGMINSNIRMKQLRVIISIEYLDSLPKALFRVNCSPIGREQRISLCENFMRVFSGINTSSTRTVHVQLYRRSRSRKLRFPHPSRAPSDGAPPRATAAPSSASPPADANLGTEKDTEN